MNINNTLYFGNYKITYEICNNNIILICQDDSNKILGIAKTNMTIENLVRWINWRIAQNICLKYIADVPLSIPYKPVDYPRIHSDSRIWTRAIQNQDTGIYYYSFSVYPEEYLPRMYGDWQQTYWPQSEPQKPTIESVD